MDNTPSSPPILTAGQTQWAPPTPYLTGQQMTGWSNIIPSPTFKAGDLIFCYIVDVNNDIWGTGALPLPADKGIFNVTLYLKFKV
jgi:hypothetical protein